MTKLIPISVIELCQKFYPIHQYIDFSIYNPDYFERIEMEQELKIILKTKTYQHWTGFYSKIGFNEGIINWKLRCVKNENSDPSDSFHSTGKAPAIVANITISNTDTNKKKLSDCWFNESESSTRIDRVYYLFQDTMWEFSKGAMMQGNKSKYSSIWKIDDQLIMTLDFDEKIFQIVRIRDNEDDAIWSINIDPSKTYYPAFGCYAKGETEFELVLA